MFHIYFARSLKNGKVYVGVTSKKPEERVKEHNSSSNKWSKTNGPLQLAYYESYICKEDTFLREKFYKMGFGKTIKSIILKRLDKDS